ncbi:MAG: DUF881 domain-containing protein [Caloramator sp.]|nr:DUF881 domain-containing protein [Caloramator sp.]
MKINEGKALLLFTGILTGILLSIFIINTTSKPAIILTYQQYQKYNSEANELKSEIKGLYKDKNDLVKKLSNYYKSNQKNKSVTDTLRKELDEIKLFAGKCKVQGTGIMIVIDDRHDYINNEQIMSYITHNTDILRVVNELRNAGAEAISVNGKRITDRTAITCEGPIIMVNGEYIVPPFEILAIGDPEALQYALSLPESHISLLKDRGLYVKIVKKDRITIDELSQKFTVEYMKNIE